MPRNEWYSIEKFEPKFEKSSFFQKPESGLFIVSRKIFQFLYLFIDVRISLMSVWTVSMKPWRTWVFYNFCILIFLGSQSFSLKITQLLVARKFLMLPWAIWAKLARASFPWKISVSNWMSNCYFNMRF